MPVYNVEEYLRRCVDSLLDQGDFKDYEIILVDDGATDSSGVICDEYAQKFDLVKVIHKENGGLSSARNAGIKAAKGEYIMFVDSDDYIKTDVLSSVISTITDNNLDILSFNFSYVYDNGQVKVNDIKPVTEDEYVSGKTFLLKNINSGTMIMTAWKNVYKNSLIIDNNLMFREGFVHEDEEWTPRVYYVAEKVGCYYDSIYGYLIRNNSISNNNHRKATLDLLENCKSLTEFAKTINETELRNAVENNIVTLALSAFYKGRLTDHTEFVLGIVSGLYTDKRNQKKISLLKRGAGIYIFVNYFTKKLSDFKDKISDLTLFFKKLVEYSKQQIRRKLRKIFVCKKQRKSLHNHSFSIISSTCNGGVITSELGEQFRTPTINLWFEPGDYLKLINNLKYYMSLDVKEVKNNFYSYPVGRIGDITVYFMHYHTFEDAREKWNKRKQRINYDNLYFMMAEKDNCTAEQVEAFEIIAHKDKVIFTYNEYPEYESTICVKDCSKDGEAAIMTDFVGLYGRKYDKYFDYVKWLNGEEL